MTKSFPAIQYVKGVGPSLAKAFEKMGIFGADDLLYFFPRAYEDRRHLPPISRMMVGEIRTCVGQLSMVNEKKPKPRMSVIEAVLDDGVGKLVAVWFNQKFLKDKLKSAKRVLVRGKVELNRYTGELKMVVQETTIINTPADEKMHLGRVVPIYSLSAGLTQAKVRHVVKLVVDQFLTQVVDVLPAALKDSKSLMDVQEAIRLLHFPKDSKVFAQARYRMVFEEFFLFQLALGLQRTHVKKAHDAPVLSPTGQLEEAYRKSLPYTFTSAQSSVINEIAQDVVNKEPMNRLVQGDVGSGKTDVAVMALLFALQSGYKGAIMVPTDILATQHYQKFCRYLEPLGIDVMLLKGKMRKKEKQAVLERLKEPTPMVVVGTHALIQDTVAMADLGLVVVDEQHKFGVVQRMNLRKKGRSPHCLFMTATPIPRTFMLTCYGDLDKSIIDEMPPGRVPPKTAFVKPKDSGRMYEFVRELVAKGEQVYVVYPLVEESEKLDLKSAEEGYEDLKSSVFLEYKVGLIHGRLSKQDKDEVMTAFKQGDIQVLVSTTVIEVGVDVPAATTMIVHHAERFGLSQLHQLRGRVGRGGGESYCFLVAAPKTDEGKERLQAMVDTADGFKIAEVDMKIRGPGDMLGVRQSGLPDFKLGDIVRDEAVLLDARKAAFAVAKADPSLAHPTHSRLKEQLILKHGLFLGRALN